jgi:hypothetical protein
MNLKLEYLTMITGENRNAADAGPDAAHRASGRAEVPQRGAQLSTGRRLS